MMKIAYLNTYNNGSTGRIVESLKDLCIKYKVAEVISIHARGPKSIQNTSAYQYHNKLEFLFNALFTRLFDAHGLGNILNTLSVIRRLKVFAPDIIHLHNLHGYWINYIILFKYIKKHKIKVIWTFHDCWHFTGHCTHFDYVGCQKWIDGCYDCPQLREFPSSFIDFSKRNYKLKKKYFTSIDRNDLMIVTPSDWLKRKVTQSFLRNYKVEVIHNGIDVNVFKPSSNIELRRTILRQGYEAIVLGIAAFWNERKGLDYIKYVANKKPEWFFVIVGAVKENQEIPLKNVKQIDRTENVDELRNLYSCADVLAQPTLEDTYPTTNLEAIACGTPVVTFPTGGSEEIVRESAYGIITDRKTADALCQSLEKVINNKLTLNTGFEFDSSKTFIKYIDLYKRIYNDK